MSLEKFTQTSQENVLRKLCLDENEITLNNFTIAFSESSLKRLSVKNTHTLYFTSYCLYLFLFSVKIVKYQC